MRTVPTISWCWGLTSPASRVDLTPLRRKVPFGAASGREAGRRLRIGKCEAALQQEVAARDMPVPCPPREAAAPRRSGRAARRTRRSDRRRKLPLNWPMSRRVGRSTPRRTSALAIAKRLPARSNCAASAERRNRPVAHLALQIRFRGANAAGEPVRTPAHHCRPERAQLEAIAFQNRPRRGDAREADRAAPGVYFEHRRIPAGQERHRQPVHAPAAQRPRQRHRRPDFAGIAAQAEVEAGKREAAPPAV